MRVDLSHPALKLLAYALGSILISGGIAWWLGARTPAPVERPFERPLEQPADPEGTAALRDCCPDAEDIEPSGPAAEVPSDGGPVELPEGEAPPVISAREPLRELSSRGLQIPVQGVEVDELGDHFDDPRSGGRRHKALDIMAPRKTPVLAVEGGRIARIMASPRGGLSIYHFDPTETFCYFYAHLDGYAPGLKEGDPVVPGQVLGYVGTTGNAPDNAPHLHFAIHVLPPSKRCLRGPAINPAEVLRGSLP